MLSTFGRIKIPFNIRQKCFKAIRMWFLRPWSTVGYCDSVATFCVQAYFPLSLQRAGHAVFLFPVLGWQHVETLAVISEALSSWEATNLASSLTALFKTKSRISYVLRQEVFLLEGNLHSVPTHRSSKIGDSLSGLWLIHCSCVCHLQCSGIVSRCQ